VFWSIRLMLRGLVWGRKNSWDSDMKIVSVAS